MTIAEKAKLIFRSIKGEIPEQATEHIKKTIFEVYGYTLVKPAVASVVVYHGDHSAHKNPFISLLDNTTCDLIIDDDSLLLFRRAVLKKNRWHIRIPISQIDVNEFIALNKIEHANFKDSKSGALLFGALMNGGKLFSKSQYAALRGVGLKGSTVRTMGWIGLGITAGVFLHDLQKKRGVIIPYMEDGKIEIVNLRFSLPCPTRKTVLSLLTEKIGEFYIPNNVQP